MEQPQAATAAAGGPSDHPEKKPQLHQTEKSGDYAPYPKLDPIDLETPPLSSGPTVQPQSDPRAPPASAAATTMPAESNPYVTSAPVAASSSRSKCSAAHPCQFFLADAMDSVKDVLGRWGKKVGEAAKATEDLAGNVWQHLKTGPSVAESAMGMLAQSSKVIAEGGYEKIFKNTFDTVPDEQLKKTYACYLSTSAGPVLGILYLSSAKLAFCSDSPLSYKIGDKTEWSYYKVVIPLHQLRTVNPTPSKVNPAEKYIQVVSIDNHEFWFMGFVNYDNAVKSLQEASVHNQQP